MDASEATPPRVVKLRYLSQSIQRCLDVLETLAESDGGAMTLAELSSTLELPKSTTLRLLANLEARQFVSQDAARRYRIGLRLFSIGSQALARDEIRLRARPFLEEIAEQIGESAYLAICDQDQVLYIDRVESPQPSRALSPIGAYRPMHATAVGKVLLADLDNDAIAAILHRRGLAPLTPRTITEPAQLTARLDEVRVRGYEVDVGEFQEELTCLAAPIREKNGRAVAAIGLSGPTWRLVDARLSTAIASLCKAAASVSEELGYRTPEIGREPMGSGA